MTKNSDYLYSVGQQSHQGGRDYNEDRVAIFERDNGLLLVLADGLGGHAGGDIASQALVDAMGDSFNKATDKQLAKADSFLTLSINYAHHSVHRHAVNRGFSVDSPKTTCVVCLIFNGIATWAHVGDSRLYLIRGRSIEFITDDHISKKPGHENNAPISRCVGGLESPKPEVSEPHEMREGETLLLATDGAWATFRVDDLFEYVDSEHPTLGLDNMLQELERRNKVPSDNLSVVVCFWGVRQLDKPSINEYETTDTIQLLHQSVTNDENRNLAGSNKKFDMTDLDSTINEIESFISDIDDKF